MSRCPSCGSGKMHLLVNSTDGAKHCVEFGTVYWSDGSRRIPRRSQPAEVKSLPDAEGWWYDVDHRGYFPVTHYGLENGSFSAGRYVQCHPPILPPEQAKDADLEEVRKAYRANDDVRFDAAVARIADRLEAK